MNITSVNLIITLILFVIPYYLFLSILDDVEDKKPVDGMWTTWSSWKECTKTCGIGERTRLRDCRNPPPKNSGAYCVGPMSETEYCQSASCPDPSVSIVPPPRPGKKVDDIRGFRFFVFVVASFRIIKGHCIFTLLNLQTYVCLKMELREIVLVVNCALLMVVVLLNVLQLMELAKEIVLKTPSVTLTEYVMKGARQRMELKETVRLVNYALRTVFAQVNVLQLMVLKEIVLITKYVTPTDFVTVVVLQPIVRKEIARKVTYATSTGSAIKVTPILIYQYG